MLYKKLVSLFLLITLAGQIAIAEDKQPVFTHIKAGEKAPFAGFLFTPEAITKVYTTVEEEKKELELQHNAEVGSLNLEVQRQTELRISEIAIKNKFIENLTKNKDKEIENREVIIRGLQEEISANKFFVIGSFAAGVVLTGVVFYAVSGIVK